MTTPIIALDVGNSHIFGGVFVNDQLIFTFRRNSKMISSSDEYGLFLRQVLRENDINPKTVQAIIISSVVPEINHSLSSACIKYFDIRPLMLQAGLKTGLKVTTKNPLEVGADRIANAVAAVKHFPNQNLAIVDLGTANTICVVNKKQEWQGGLIMPGLRLSMLALEQNTSKLPTVEITFPEELVGRTTVSNIQLGLYYSTYGLMKTYLEDLRSHHFKGEDMLVVGTGGFARLFEDKGIFDFLLPDLVLQGLLHVLKMNT